MFTYAIRTSSARIGGDPKTIGDRLVRTLDALSASDPSVFTNWQVTDHSTKSSVPLGAARARIGAVIENNVVRDDLGEPDPGSGYDVWAYTDVADASRLMHLWIKAGGKRDGHVWLKTGAPTVRGDLSIVTFPIFKAALLALVANWPLPWTCAHHSFKSNYAMVPVHGGAGYKLESRPMLPTFPNSPFEIPWIGYLSADLVAGIKLTSEIKIERVPNGGLLMIATEDRLDPDDPEHLRRARIIAETMIACTGWKPREGARG